MGFVVKKVVEFFVGLEICANFAVFLKQTIVLLLNQNENEKVSFNACCRIQHVVLRLR